MIERPASPSPAAPSGAPSQAGSAAVDAAGRLFSRKVGGSRFALFLERMWPRLWLVIGVVGLFVLASLFGIWPALGREAHVAGLAVFALALLATLVHVARTPWPSRDAALRRLERRSHVPHRPASSYEDTLSAGVQDPATQALWQAHRDRLTRTLSRLRVGMPEPKVDRADPFAARAVLMLAVVAGLALVGDSARDRLFSAFRFGGPVAALADARLDAWLTPPAYTAKAPILLADGGQPLGQAARDPLAVIDVPAGSTLIARLNAGGVPVEGLAIELLDEAGASIQRVEAAPPPPAAGAEQRDSALATGPSQSPARPVAVDSGEVRADMAVGVVAARVMSGRREAHRWRFNVIPDMAPVVELTREVEKTRRGGMKLYYKLTDDYGIATAEAKFEQLPPDEGDPRTAWARPDVLKGPRLPLDRPPQVSLRLPPANAKDGETWSFQELGSHPWAGMRVRMTLVARDHAGNVGTSKPVEMTLPERQFRNPLARAVIEQRRKLVTDSRYSPLVRKALAALTLEPDGFIKDSAVFLGLRSVYHRLKQDRTRAGLTSAVEHLWHIAQRIEDGRGLSDAERRLRELQDKLAEAIKNGASDEELKRLMDELRQALAEYMNQLAKQAENNPQMQMPQGMNPSQTMRPEDLERMLQNLENMARQGSKDMAQEMLSQLRDLIDRLQSGRMANQGQQGQQGQQMMQMMDQFGNLIGEQQRLMDDTFGAQRGDQDGQQGQQGQQGQGQQGQRGQGQQGQRGQGQRGQGQAQQGQGQRGQGQRGQGQRGQGQQQGQGQGDRFSPDALGRRQGGIGDQLDRLRRGMQQFGMRPPGQFDGAKEAMENAERALREGDLDTATREQSRALEQLRQGAQSMAEQMLRQMPSRFGRAQNAPLDPLGRPQRTEGPDLGTSVKVPDEVDVQRAREILEELRRRLGERFRPELEIEYLERLLKRF